MTRSYGIYVLGVNASRIHMIMEYPRAEVAAGRLTHCIGDVYQQILHWQRHAGSQRSVEEEEEIQQNIKR